MAKAINNIVHRGPTDSPRDIVKCRIQIASHTQDMKLRSAQETIILILKTFDPAQTGLTIWVSPERIAHAHDVLLRKIRNGLKGGHSW